MTIEELRTQYYNAIEKLQNKEDIINALPKTDYKNFFDLIKGIINKIDESINEIEQMITQEKDQETLQYMREEIEICEFKKRVCNELYNNAKTTEKIEELSIKIEKKHLIFAKTNSENIYIEKDLKEIPKEEYSDVIKCIERLETGEQDNNNEKGKSYGNNNAKISGIKTIKEYQKRLYYKTLTPDTVYVMLLISKKDDNSSIDRQTIIERNKKTEKQYNMLKEEMKNNEKKQKIIDENKQILENIYRSIKGRKRD